MAAQDFPRRHRLLAAALAVACLLTLVLGLRLAAGALHWSERRDLPIQSWMTLGFVAHAWQVDRDRLSAALGFAPTPGTRPTLAEIAGQTGRPLPEVVATLERAVAAAEAE